MFAFTLSKHIVFDNVHSYESYFGAHKAVIVTSFMMTFRGRRWGFQT